MFIVYLSSRSSFSPTTTTTGGLPELLFPTLVKDSSDPLWEGSDPDKESTRPSGDTVSRWPCTVTGPAVSGDRSWLADGVAATGELERREISPLVSTKAASSPCSSNASAETGELDTLSEFAANWPAIAGPGSEAVGLGSSLWLVGVCDPAGLPLLARRSLLPSFWAKSRNAPALSNDLCCFCAIFQTLFVLWAKGL